MNESSGLSSTNIGCTCTTTTGNYNRHAPGCPFYTPTVYPTGISKNCTCRFQVIGLCEIHTGDYGTSSGGKCCGHIKEHHVGLACTWRGCGCPEWVALRRGRSSPPPILRGTHNPRAKLDDQTATAIRDRRRQGESSLSLSKEFGVTREEVNRIARGVAWSHLG